jgi:small GTP-binding protein
MFIRFLKRLPCSINSVVPKYFSRLNELEKYSLKKHLNTYFKRQEQIKTSDKFTKEEKEEVSYMQTPLEKTFYPSQHPKNMDYSDTGIISYKPAVRNLTPFYTLPAEVTKFTEAEYVSPPESRALDICILGPTNAGKSALLNQLVGLTVSAVSPKYNTTREPTKGILTEQSTQLCFYDTPGAIGVDNKADTKILITKAWNIMNECDKVLFVVDSVKHLNEALRSAVKRLRNTTRSVAEQRYFDKLKAIRDNKSIPIMKELREELAGLEEIDDSDNSPQIPTILLLNKIDLATSKDKLRALQRELEDLGQFEKTVFISAKTGYGIESLKQMLLAEAKSRPWSHNPKTKSVQCLAEKAGELMRQEIYNKFYKDIPYNVGIKITSWVPRSNGELIIDYQLDVQRKIHVGILLGEKGRIMEDVKAQCIAELCKLFSRPVKIKVNIVHHKK